MRLCVATPLYPPEAGGPATYAKILFEGLPELGDAVSVVKFADVRRYPRALRHLVYAWQVFRAARKSDLVLALDPVSVGVPAACAALLARKPLAVKIVGDYAWEQGRQRFGLWQSLDDFVREAEVPLPVYLLRVLQIWTARRARRVIVPSDYLKRIIAAWGIAPEHIEVIQNAVPVPVLGAVPEAVAALGSPRIVTAGRLVPWKGMHGVITAMRVIRESYPGAELVVIGDGPQRAELERYAAARLKDGYTFTGSLPHDETLAVMASADIFVLNSTYEGLSHLLIEALMLGKPIVATKAGGNPEVIKDGESGLLVSVGDPDQVAKACSAILSDAGLRSRLSLAAQRESGAYGQDRMLAATRALLLQLV